jgi:PAS domain S-box-containing protein
LFIINEAKLLSASQTDSHLIRPKRKKPARTQDSEFSDQTLKLLALAEQVAHFGSWELDITKPLANWSPGMFSVFGVKPLAKGVSWEEYLSFIHPEDVQSAVKNAETMMNSPLNHRESFDYRIIHNDGSLHIIRSQRQVVKVDAQGKAEVVVGVDQDITEQKQSEEALRRSEERFRAVAEAANVMVYEYDLVNSIVHVVRGEKELMGFEPREGGNRTIGWFTSRIHPKDITQLLAVWNKAKNNPDVNRYSLEYRVRHKDGRYIIVKDTAKAVKDSRGKTVLFIGGIRDITQRKHDQNKIQQYNKHLEDLVEERTKQLQEKERLATIGQTAGMVGHDIRNPLQAITSDIYLISEELKECPKCSQQMGIQESLCTINGNIFYINKIISDLQDYTRPIAPNKTETNVKVLIDTVVAAVKIPQTIKTQIIIAPELTIFTDQDYLRRILTNLILNATQAIPDTGSITIEAVNSKDKALIIIKDSGVGIPKDVREKLFTPLFTTKAKGQGLGLAVVKRLVEGLNGSIKVESQKAKGTKFTVELPLQK